MRSSFDLYLDGASLLHCRDPRAKLLAMLVLVVALVLVPVGCWMAFGLFSLLVLALVVVAHIPLARLLRQLLVVLPFVLPAVLFLPFLHGGTILWQVKMGGWHLTLGDTGLVLAGSILLKAILSAFALGVLVATTRMADLLRGVDALGAPRLLTTIFGFMYRYLFVIEDEAHRLRAGRDVRYYGGLLIGIRSVGHMAGSLFIRSYDRAERVYGAMLLRGYDGTHRSLNSLRVGWADVLMVMAMTVLAVSISLAGRWL
ncbi:MAG: cobalt ECF transporter T component CbiQ [Dehalococcoidia bacterium]|nr:cobalt ECF transporter T component CbiQ [Dehalococcoidia bacterium]